MAAEGWGPRAGAQGPRPGRPPLRTARHSGLQHASCTHTRHVLRLTPLPSCHCCRHTRALCSRAARRPGAQPKACIGLASLPRTGPTAGLGHAARAQADTLPGTLACARVAAALGCAPAHALPAMTCGAHEPVAWKPKQAPRQHSVQ